VPDLLNEARWGLQWLLSVQEPDGGFRNTTCQERYGPYGTNRPERMSPYHAGEVGTIATGRAVGTLAFASVLYCSRDAAFAEQSPQSRAGRLPLPSRLPRRAVRVRSRTRGWDPYQPIIPLASAACGTLGLPVLQRQDFGTGEREPAGVKLRFYQVL
jgi:hypothetical protein